jgi:NAD(P)-dependent dehydrogenase (short-subunit alcohol dehydrogenase family)
MEGREYGIRANSISPGIIETAQSRDQLNDKEWADYMLRKTLLGRLENRRKSPMLLSSSPPTKVRS